MKTQRILLGLMLGIFLMASVSAITTSYGEWQDGSSSTTITNGQSVGFNVYFESTTTPMSISAKLYDSSNNLVHTFIEQPVAQTYYFNSAPIQITPAIYSNPGSFVLIFSSSDSQGTSTRFISLTVNPLPPPANSSPVITTTPITTVNENNVYTYDVNATDADGDILTYTLTSAPSWLSINSATGLITGTAPSILTNTSYAITVQVSDGTHTVAQSYTLNEINIPVIGNAPVITILGSNPITIQAGFAYADAGATATDVEDGNLTANITVLNNVNISHLGNYTVLYSVTDSAGNNVSATRNVSVVDTTAPVITLNGANTISISKGGTYTEFGATALDNLDGILPVIFSGSVNVNSVGTYTITYTATDSYNNTGTATRTIHVVSSSSHSSSSSGNIRIVSSPSQTPETKSESISLPPVNLGGQSASSSSIWTILFIMVIILILAIVGTIIVLLGR